MFNDRCMHACMYLSGCVWVVLNVTRDDDHGHGLHSKSVLVEQHFTNIKLRYGGKPLAEREQLMRFASARASVVPQ